jgi:hypothetical protein
MSLYGSYFINFFVDKVALLYQHKSVKILREGCKDAPGNGSEQPVPFDRLGSLSTKSN